MQWQRRSNGEALVYHVYKLQCEWISVMPYADRKPRPYQHKACQPAGFSYVSM